MLFGKPKMADEERKRWEREINDLINKGDNKAAYQKTLEMEKLDKDAAGFFMGFFYFMGEVVREDYREASRRLERYTNRVQDNADAWVIYGNVMRMLDNETAAAECFLKGSRLGNLTAKTQLASCCRLQADQFRGQAAGTLDVRQYSQSNSKAVTLYTKAVTLYDEVVQKDPKAMDAGDWFIYGRTVDVLYALSLNGELKKVNYYDNDAQNYFRVSLSIVSGQADQAAHQYWRALAVRTLAGMEQAGHGAMAEYFRAALCMDECTKQKKPEPFLAVRWHMDRAQDLAAQLDAARQKELASDFDDYLAQYRQLDKKYGKMIQNMIRQGVMPQVAADYGPEGAPAPETCPSFLRFMQAAKTGAPAPGPSQPEPKKKGLFGLFGR